jgi:regulator of sigma E protease
MEGFLYSIGSAVIGLGLLIVFHEFGHFLLAKLSGVGVLTFSVGFGPKILVRKKGETEYALSAFPLGGYVKMVGEDPNEEVSAADKERSPAERAGITKGDRVVAIDGKPVVEWENLSQTIKSSEGRPLSLEIRRGSELVKLTVQPTRKEGRNIFGERKDDWLIGIGSQVSIEKGKPGLAVGRAFSQTWDYIKITVLGFYKMVMGDVSPKNIGGPILIAQMAGQQAQEGVGSFLAFLAVLSINLGVLNLLPVPVLDGGHLLFFLVEAVIRKPVSIRVREMAQQVGICLLGLLMVYAFYNDIVRFFEKQVGG